MGKKNNRQNSMNNNRGVALIIVMTSITFLSVLLINFVFDTNVNQMRVYNKHEKTIAGLNAEAGLKLAIARLKLYKEARNLLEKNKKAKDLVKINDLNIIWSFPFILPFPLAPDANILQKEAFADFAENNVIPFFQYNSK